MPPRAEHELDPVTLHNQALVSLALAATGGGGSCSGASGSSAQSGAEAFDKLVHLLEHPPFPPELAGNLLSLCCRPDGVPGGGGPGAAERAAVAARLLAEHRPAVEGAVPGELLPLYEACVARASSAEEAAARLDALAGTHIDGLRRRVKAVQDARWAGDAAGAAAGLQAYEDALDAYVPGEERGVVGACLGHLTRGGASVVQCMRSTYSMPHGRLLTCVSFLVAHTLMHLPHPPLPRQF